MGKRPVEPRKPTENQQPEPLEQSTQLAQKIEKQIGPLVTGSQRAEVVSRVVALMNENFSGPIAHPRHLQAYENIVPGAANRIIEMAEKEQEHNREMEADIVRAQINDQKLGMWLGFSALLIIVILAFIAGMYDKPAIAALLLGAGVIGSIGAFVKGRYSK